MNHIGTIIKEFRIMRNMTRNELAEDICTEKYIYLIEKGKRTPSTDYLRLFSNRLTVDLFVYYKFIDCIDPVKVCEIIDKLTVCQKNSNFIETEKLVKIAKEMSDFKIAPWVYILKANQIACKVFNEKKYEESIIDINSTLENVDIKYMESIYVLSFYVLLSSCYQILGQLNDVKNIILKIEDIIKDKYNNTTYNHITITGGISLLTFYFHTKEFDEAIYTGESLIEFQLNANSMDRIHYSFVFLAYTYFESGKYDKAFLYFNKAILLLMTYYNLIDAYYIMSIDLFYVMAKDERMNKDVMCLFFEIYKNIS